VSHTKTSKAQKAPTEGEMTQALRVGALSYNHRFCDDSGREQLSHSTDRTLSEAEAQGRVYSAEQECVRHSKRITLQVIQVSRKTHTNGFPNLSVEEEVCESRNTENKECRYKHIHRGT